MEISKKKRTPLNADEHRQRFKDHVLRIYAPGLLGHYSDQVPQSKWWMTSIHAKQTLMLRQEGNYDIYYSCHDAMRQFGCAFAVNKRIARFTPVDERLHAEKDYGCSYNKQEGPYYDKNKLRSTVGGYRLINTLAID